MTAVSTDLAIVSTLRQLPLFMGMSDMELKEILARVKCLYRKVGPGEPIVSQATGVAVCGWSWAALLRRRPIPPIMTIASPSISIPRPCSR